MTILIAEDDSVSSLLLRQALEGVGEEVLSASNGEAAWRIVRDRADVRIVISDWMMPRLDGIDLCRRVRALSDRPYVYFILLTARAFREDRLAGLAAGADDFLAKPLDRAELLARLNVARRLLTTQEELRLRSEELERLHVELRRQNARLAELATSDDLTGLKNHRHFRGALEEGVSLANRQGVPFSLVMLDVDHFKQYNDAFGHPAGDEVLRDLARSLREGVREHDVVARYGGEEFVMLLPMTDAEAALGVGERLRAAIAARPWPFRPITASLGIATTGPHVTTPALLLDLADRALYHSKASGRDRVTHACDLDAFADGSPRHGPGPVPAAAETSARG
jgi:two-component system chemotaxis response regulator CheY